MKTYKRRLLWPHSKETCITKWKKKLPAKKIYSKNNVTAKDSFKKCIQAETFETQVSWSLDLCTHKWHHSRPRLSYNDEEKVKKNIILARKINRNLSLINQHYNTMSSPENWKTFLFYKYVKYDTRWNATCAGF